MRKFGCDEHYLLTVRSPECKRRIETCDLSVTRARLIYGIRRRFVSGELSAYDKQHAVANVVNLLLMMIDLRGVANRPCYSEGGTGRASS